LQEPLLHFLLIGIALFVVHGQVAVPDRAGKRIVISEALVDQLAREYEARWTRKASDRELDALVEARVRDEIIYREGMALGLDRDDELIRRRVRQKFEVIAEEDSGRSAPSDADLEAFLTANADRFVAPAKVSFEQIFFADRGTPADLERAIDEARRGLARGSDPARLGQASMLAARVEATAQTGVAREFGAEFARQLQGAPIGEWIGPIRSAFGAHLVRVTLREPAARPALGAVRQAVAREWESARRESARDENYQKLRARYTVVVETKGRATLAAQR